MANENPFHNQRSERALELIDLAQHLNREYAELIQVSAVLKKDSRQLVEDSRILRSSIVRLRLSLVERPG